ncbi:MAG: LysM peptidoglycan-binding domain-containing protein [Clostridia bacterium]|nr:LysM peptidoglycan-binding domain-containing protein [Clostridia bacterium]
MEINEVNVNELEKAVGGRGGYRYPPEWIEGLEIYQIKRGDNLTKIARKYHTTWMHLQELNADVIPNKNDITDGYYIYVPALPD